MLAPLLRNSIERVYKAQIDSLLTNGIQYFMVIVRKLLQLIFILLFWPTLLSKIPNFMRADAQKEYEPVAEVLLDKNFPRKLIVSWKMIRGTIIAVSLGYILIAILAFISQFRK